MLPCLHDGLRTFLTKSAIALLKSFIDLESLPFLFLSNVWSLSKSTGISEFQSLPPKNSGLAFSTTPVSVSAATSPSPSTSDSATTPSPCIFSLSTSRFINFDASRLSAALQFFSLRRSTLLIELLDGSILSTNGSYGCCTGRGHVRAVAQSHRPACQLSPRFTAFLPAEANRVRPLLQTHPALHVMCSVFSLCFPHSSAPASRRHRP